MIEKCPVTNKDKFASQESTQEEIDRRGWENSTPYLCNHCGGWHIRSQRASYDDLTVEDKHLISKLRDVVMHGKTAIVERISSNISVHRYAYLGTVYTFKYNSRKKTLQIISQR